LEKINFLIKRYLFIFFIFSWAVQLPPLMAHQEREQERIVEKVTVTNVEVPVRVLYKGKPVTHLTKEDFEIYENKKKMKIHGFFIKRKKINAAESTENKELEKEIPSRTFVLVFSITDFNDNVRAAVDYFFKNVLKKNDRLLIFANARTSKYVNLEDKEKIKCELMTHLREESRKARRRLINYINTIETYLNTHDFRVALFRINTPARQVIDFLKAYLVTWKEYKQRYLTPNIDRFYHFSRYLEKIKSKKWVLNFYQFELYPKIRLDSRTMDKIRDIATQLINSNEGTQYALGKVIFKLLNRIYVELNVRIGFPTEEISKLFYKADATFHSFFIKRINKANLNDFEYEEVASDIENTLKKITDITGGQNITSNNLVNSINTVGELEDVYYMLTYVPVDPNKAGKLKIKVKNKKYRVLYDDNFRADYIADHLERLEETFKTPDIKIKNFSFKQKMLAFTVEDYLVEELDEKTKLIGKTKVRIRVTDKNNNPLFDQEKVLTAYRAEIKISLDAFKEIKRGEYNFLIDASDLLTGKQTNFHETIIIK
jgi:hypothetical protein